MADFAFGRHLAEISDPDMEQRSAGVEKLKQEMKPFVSSRTKMGMDMWDASAIGNKFRPLPKISGK